MAVAPLFAANIAALKAELRLTGLKSGSDAESILNRATSAARVYLYQRLGLTTVSEMLAQVEVDNPTTSVQVRRKAATLVEVELVRCELLELMPVLVGDASAEAQQAYNTEGVWRQVTPEERGELLKRCKIRIEELLELIASEDELGEDLSVRTFDGSRENSDERYPAGTILPGIGKFPGNFEEDYHVGNDEVVVRFEHDADTGSA